MPRKPSPERIFRSHHPDARIERQKGNGFGRSVYFFVRRWPGGSPRHDWDGCGDTPAQAWKDACDRHELSDLKVEAKS